MHFLVAVNLVGHCSKEAGPVLGHLLYNPAFLVYLLLELNLSFLKLLLGPLHERWLSLVSMFIAAIVTRIVNIFSSRVHLRCGAPAGRASMVILVFCMVLMFLEMLILILLLIFRHNNIRLVS